MRLTINCFLIISCFFILFSCQGNQKGSDRLKEYFAGLNIETKETSVIIIDPTYCGSCTQYTISWINKHRQKNHYRDYFILTTDTIPKVLSKGLMPNKFRIIQIDGTKLKRLGYGGYVSYNFTFDKNGEISKQIIKSRWYQAKSNPQTLSCCIEPEAPV